MVKTRESGMPEEGLWIGFFRPDEVLHRLGLGPQCEGVVDFGCGYGTFTIPAAKVVKSTVYALDIDPAMVSATRAKAEAAGLGNVLAVVRDFVAEGTGLAAKSVDYAMLFNILHAECPAILLDETFRVLRPGGLLAIVHWSYDPATPRGPSMEIRPRPDDCRQWAEQAGFRLWGPGVVELPPYHYGMLLARP